MPFTSTKSYRSRPTGPEAASVHGGVEYLVVEDLYDQRVLSLANGVVGLLHAATLAIHAIGEGPAVALDLEPKLENWSSATGAPVASSAPMLLVDVERWGQTIDDLRDAAYRADHSRTRERFLSLYEIARGTNATQVALLTGRCDESVMAWVHACNERGPGALTFQRTRGRPPFAPVSKPRSAPSSAKPSPSRRRRP